MSSTKSVTLATTRQGSHEPCPCGCSPCPDDGCGLECLARPRFFCGQLLTDQDLEVLVGWTRDRLALSRYRHGWGVVCGLDVHCDPDPKRPAGVIVSPGYAVSCCGDDIVLCEEAKLDLRDACREDEEPCTTDLRLRWTSLELPVIREWAVDLFLRYREEPSEPQAALGRSACKEVSACEPSRVRESYELVWKPAVSGSDSRKIAADLWEKEYKRCTEVLDAFEGRFGTGSSRDFAEIRRWLLGWIAEHPLHQFCFVREKICDMSGKPGEADLVRVLFLLVQDCRNAFLQGACHACKGSEDVPLARICLVKEESRECRVCSIDPYPPYRRPLSPAGFPAALGDVNLGPWIWHREEEVCMALANLGVKVHESQPFAIPATLAELRRQLAGPIFASCGEPAVCLQVLDLEPLREPCLPGGGRVVGFLCEPEIEVKAIKNGPWQVSVQIGRAEYVYHLSVSLRNTTVSPLDLTISDALAPVLTYQRDDSKLPRTLEGRDVRWKKTLAEGELFQLEWSLVVLAQIPVLAQQVTVNNSFNVIGKKPDGTVVFTRTSNVVYTTIGYFDIQTISLDAKAEGESETETETEGETDAKAEGESAAPVKPLAPARKKAREKK